MPHYMLMGAELPNTLPNGQSGLCPRCGQHTKICKGPYGNFAGCVSYPSCKGVLKLKALDIVVGSYTPPSEETVEAPSPGAEETPMPKRESMPVPEPANPSDAGSALWSLVRHHAYAETAEVARKVAQEVASQQGPAKIEWTVNGLPFAKVDGTHHAALPEVLKRLKAGIKNILLVGPAGSGKTQLAADIAKALGTEMTAVSCTAGMPEWHIVGRSMPNLQTGESVYQESAFVKHYREGGVGLLDEIDAADPNTLLVMNSALSNGHMDLPHAGMRISRSPNFVFIAAANTYGNGADRIYAGRNQLDASTLSRFACGVIAVDYDRKLEEALVPDYEVRSRVHSIRDRVAELKIRRVVGTRELLNVYALTQSGESLKFAIKAMTAGWTAEELSRVDA